jgi:hypothetical protein
MKRPITILFSGLIAIEVAIIPSVSFASTSSYFPLERTIGCDLLIAGGGLSGVATAYEGLLAGKKICMTEITDWMGGQISSQGVSALDERPTQREKNHFPRGYIQLRDRIKAFYNGNMNPGKCWVSVSCFLPKDGHKILAGILKDAERQGNGTLYWLPNTVIKDVTRAKVGNGQQITRVVGIHHAPQPGTQPLNTEPLSGTFSDAYKYENSPRLRKQKVTFVPNPYRQIPDRNPADWYVIDATETGELIGLTDVPHRLGLDPRTGLEPSAASLTNDPYCAQGFTYTFAMETTQTPQPQQEPPFYQQYAPYYSYELKRLADFGLVHTYRRIYSEGKGEATKFGGINYTAPAPGDISMQNWTWGNDYRPGSSGDNLILDRTQLAAAGQLQPGGWMGGLRPETLKKGEENAIGFYHWLVAGTTDSQAKSSIKPTDTWMKSPNPNHRYVTGLDSPMGTAHGLSKYPYIREGRRIIGRPSVGYPDGFTIEEADISRNNLLDRTKMPELSDREYQRLQARLAANTMDVVASDVPVARVKTRDRATMYPDTVGIGHYAIDFHPCMQNSPHESPSNREREGTRKGQGQAYPFQVPLRAMIPQKIDNMLVAGKSIATSHTAAAAYRVHAFEWSTGAAAATTAILAMDKGVMPYQMVADLPKPVPLILELRQRLEDNKNPTSFPNTSMFNSNWKEWK